MQSFTVRQEVKDLAHKLSSLDPVEYDSAINKYFEDHAVLDTQYIRTSGVSKIKKIAQLQNAISTESKVEQEPVYDDKKNIASFTISRTIVTPALPTWIPLSHMVSKKSMLVHWITQIHLNPGDDKKFYVTKATLKRKEQFPFEFLVPLFILRPFLTLLVLFVANVVNFSGRHKDKTAGQIVVAAVEQSITAMWLFLVSETGKRQAQAESWSDKKRGQMTKLYSSARSAAASLQSDLEARAKAAGIPVDQYKGQINSTLEEFRTKAAELQTDIEGKARKAGIPVEQYRKQVEDAIVELQKSAQGLGDYFDSKAKDAREHYNSMSNDSGSDTSPNKKFEGLPTTPLGGHDPTAPGAPSFAEAAAQ